MYVYIFMFVLCLLKLIYDIKTKIILKVFETSIAMFLSIALTCIVITNLYKTVSYNRYDVYYKHTEHTKIYAKSKEDALKQLNDSSITILNIKEYDK